MNLNDNPTLDQLRALLAAHDDDAGDHVIWVDPAGQVRVTTVPTRQRAEGFQPAYAPGARLWTEMLPAGYGYVGPAAGAENEEWLPAFLAALVRRWAAVRERPGPGELFSVNEVLVDA